MKHALFIMACALTAGSMWGQNILNGSDPGLQSMPATTPMGVGPHYRPQYRPQRPQYGGWQRPWTQRRVVSDADFNQLMSAVNAQTFQSNQLPMIQAAGLCGWFTCRQCAALMSLFSFDSNKLQVVRYLAPHIVNPMECQPIMNQLAFISDQQTAWRILSAAQY